MSLLKEPHNWVAAGRWQRGDIVQFSVEGNFYMVVDFKEILDKDGNRLLQVLLVNSAGGRLRYNVYNRAEVWIMLARRLDHKLLPGTIL